MHEGATRTRDTTYLRYLFSLYVRDNNLDPLRPADWQSVLPYQLYQDKVFCFLFFNTLYFIQTTNIYLTFNTKKYGSEILQRLRGVRGGYFKGLSDTFPEFKENMLLNSHRMRMFTYSLFTIHYSLYTLHSTLYTLHSTLYTLHSIQPHLLHSFPV